MLTALAVQASLDLDTATVARLLLAQPERPRRPRPPLDRLRPGHPGQGRAPGPWLARVVRKRHAAFVSPSGRRHTLTARSRFLLGYRGAVGVKTGFTDDAGHCLAAAATRGGRTLIAVVLHSPDSAAALLDGPGRAVERHLPAVPEALASAGLARVGATPAARPAGAQPAWSWRDRQRVAAGAGTLVALLVAVALAVHRLRQRA